MDALDRETLIALQQDGRQTNAHLAEVLGLSASAVHERVRRLERDGVVRGFHVDASRRASSACPRRAPATTSPGAWTICSTLPSATSPTWGD